MGANGENGRVRLHPRVFEYGFFRGARAYDHVGGLDGGAASVGPDLHRTNLVREALRTDRERALAHAVRVAHRVGDRAESLEAHAPVAAFRREGAHESLPLDPRAEGDDVWPACDMRGDAPQCGSRPRDRDRGRAKGREGNPINE